MGSLAFLIHVLDTHACGVPVDAVDPDATHFEEGLFFLNMNPGIE
jgi:hypothetical protein